MLLLSLHGDWKMRKIGADEWIPAEVPGSVFQDLLNAGKIADPFYRDNEDYALTIAAADYEYQKEFQVDSQLLQYDHLFLCCEGLDTITEILLNDTLVAKTDNMHRKYEFDIKAWLGNGQNKLQIRFFSPLQYISQAQQKQPTWGVPEAASGYQHLRKAHYMFGWDWGPQIPDSGIWRDIAIKGYYQGRLEDVYVTQHHGDNEVLLDIRVRSIRWGSEPFTIEVNIDLPDGRKITQSVTTQGYENLLSLNIENPELWWPNGFGKQPLYHLEVLLKTGPSVLDIRRLQIGLRTLTVKRAKDQWGESFAIEVNGVSIFGMGANYIPEDNLLARCHPAGTERLIQDCVAANFNCLRVWGGGIYPADYFYDLCDQYGLIVWQDLMFACAFYVMTDEFAENIKQEVIDNMKRIRHHACLGLWCGNNEIESAWGDWSHATTGKLRTDYIKQFEILLPNIARETDPNTFYWPASPSSGGGFEDPNNENRGDVHYWDVWHGRKPFTDYRKHCFRFVSEFGFQSFPGLKTVESFSLPEDRNIFSYIMEKHQKNQAANGKILYYLSEKFKYPKDFGSLLYASQLLQAEAIKCGVEHWRQNRGRCMGAIFWQLNDCWPVASWSSIDYYGRWKALHYFAKRFFAPLLISAREDGTEVVLYVTNERLTAFKGEIIWRLRNNASQILKAGNCQVEIEALAVKQCQKLDLSDLLTGFPEQRSTYLEFALNVDYETVSSGTVLFVKEKHFEFIHPELSLAVREEATQFIIEVTSKAFARFVELDLKEIDCRFSDNYFDLSAGEVKIIAIEKTRLSRQLTLAEMKTKLSVRSMYEIA